MDDKVVIRFVGEDDVTPTAKKVNNAVDDTGKKARKSGGGVDSLSDSLGQLTDIMKGAGVIAFAQQVTDVGLAIWDASVNAALLYDKMKLVQTSIGIMLKSKEAGDQLFATMQLIADRTPFSFEDVSKATASLIAMGFEADKIPELFNTIGNVATSTGTGAEGVDRITRALGQMQAKGKITTEEMMQLTEMGIPAFKLLAQATGTSEEALRDMVTKGVVPAATNLDTLVRAMQGNYGDVMASQLNTATVAQSNFTTATNNFNIAVGQATSPAVIGGYSTLTKYINIATAAVVNANQASNKLAVDQAKARNAEIMYWRDFVMKLPIPDVLKGISSLTFEAGINSNNAAIRELTGSVSAYGNGAAAAARYGDNLSGKLATTPLVIKPVIGAKIELKGATEENTDADKEAANALTELNRNTSEYESVLKSLRGSYMNIADAQRSVESAQKALADAMDPTRVQQMTLSIQSQAIDMRDLNQSMADMKKRREEITKALASQNTEQIRHNALTADERRQLNGINSTLANQRQERDAIRKALKEGNLTAEQRVEFLATEQALTASINQQAGQKRTLEEKQNAAVKKAQEDRLSLIEEDKRLQADLEKSQIRAKQAIIDMQIAQKALAEAQDPKRLESYRDAVTKAEQNLATLRTEQEANKVTADALAASIGVTSGSVEALRQSASDTATPLDDMGAGLDTVTSSLNKPNGFNTSTTSAGGALKKITEYADASKAGLAGFNTVLSKLPDTKGKADSLSTVADAMERIAVLFPAFDDGMFIGVQQITNAINGITNDGSSRWNSFSVNFSAALKNATQSAVKNLVEALAAINSAPGDTLAYSRKAQLSEAVSAFTKDKRLTLGEYNALTTGASRAELAFINALIKAEGSSLAIDADVPGAGTIFGIRPRVGMTMGGASQLGAGQQATNVGQVPTVQNITINLNYATPPSSDDPLGDVKRYIAAQGGRLRI
jgi:tape measure domain-containing protein